jgi:hypothetical protein
MFSTIASPMKVRARFKRVLLGTAASRRRFAAA